MFQNSKEPTKQSLTRFALFISDLHLCSSRPHITVAFLDFLQNIAIHASALYILGDLFEYWAGDDDIGDRHTQSIIEALSSISLTGVAIYFIHGNRDFLITETFCNIAKIHLLQDPTIINLFGKRVLLSHGDALCTDDVAYQKFRLQVRDPQWQASFLGQTLQARKQQIENIRMLSEQEKAHKSSFIMDINHDALCQLLANQNYPELFIHGHTHRPNTHQIHINGHNTTRWVLGDWYEQGSYLIIDNDGCRALSLDTL